MREFSAALGILALCSTVPLRANPDGKGQFWIGGGGQVSRIQQRGYREVGGTKVWEEIRVDYSEGAALGLLVPVLESLSLSLSGGMNRSRTMYENVADPFFSYRESLSHQGYSAQMGLQLYPAAFFKEPFLNADQGNPDGYLYWPFLTLRGSHIQGRTELVVERATGFAAGSTAPPPELQWVWLGEYTLALPLHRRWTLWAGYGREYYERTMGLFPEQNQGDQESWSVGSLHYLPLFNDGSQETPGRYFPGLGWPGDIGLGLSYNRRVHLGAGRYWGQSVGVSGRGVLLPWLAMSLQWDYDMLPELPLGNDLKSSIVQSNSQSLSLWFTVNFGGLPWSQQP